MSKIKTMHSLEFTETVGSYHTHILIEARRVLGRLPKGDDVLGEYFLFSRYDCDMIVFNMKPPQQMAVIQWWDSRDGLKGGKKKKKK